MAQAQRRRNPLPIAVQTLICFLVLLALSLAGYLTTRNLREDEQERLLKTRSAEVASLVSTSLGEVQSALGVLTSLTGDDNSEAFDVASAALVPDGGAVRAIGQAERSDGRVVVVGSGAGDTPRGTELTGDRLELFQRAEAAERIVTAVFALGDEVRLAYALRAPTTGRVVFRETQLTPTQIRTEVRGQPFGTLDATIYASADPDPERLVLTTVEQPLIDGQRVPIPVGADTWLLVTSARGSLNGTLGQNSPLVVLVLGLVLAVAVSALVETLARRRRYALALVDARTAALESALAERARLEEGERQAREQAEAANRAKSEFLSRMSHELRTPLNGVLGFAQLLEMDEISERQRESVVQILKGGWHLLDLINEVLDITRIETGSISLSPEAVLASDVLSECVDLMRPLAQRSGVTVLGDQMPGCSVHVYADRQRFKQVLLNLLSNAVKYNRPNGSVALSCVATPDKLALRVTDTGPGIAPEHLGLLFTPFERLGAQHGDIEGTGIGLALSHRLAEAMGGSLTVETEVGQGSTFVLSLPIVEGPLERFVRLGGTGAEAEPAADGSRRKILYIEDNLSNLRLVERLLERRLDTEVVAAMQGRLGLELARQHQPAVVLLDLHLPDLDGGEVLRLLRDDPRTASIPVIIVSADATQGQIGRLRNAGAYAYLTKPLDVPELIRLLNEILDARPSTSGNGQ